MTYCLAANVKQGLVFCSDSRTNAGTDNVGIVSAGAQQLRSGRDPGNTNPRRSPYRAARSAVTIQPTC
jgi:hypothetical protein